MEGAGAEDTPTTEEAEGAAEAEAAETSNHPIARCSVRLHKTAAPHGQQPAPPAETQRCARASLAH